MMVMMKTVFERKLLQQHSRSSLLSLYKSRGINQFNPIHVKRDDYFVEKKRTKHDRHHYIAAERLCCKNIFFVSVNGIN